MKRIYFTVASLLIISFACTKSNGFSSQPLHGSYPLVFDSTYAIVVFWTDSLSYHGTTGDYWNFASNGVLYIKEGLRLDTMSYSFPGPNKVKLVKGESDNEQDTMYYSSSGQLFLHTDPVLYTPGGFSDHTVELGKQ